MAQKPVNPNDKSLDITTAGKPKPSAQSRPLVVGNRPMIGSDPMMTGADPDKALPGAPTVRTGKTVAPTRSTPAQTHPVEPPVAPEHIEGDDLPADTASTTPPAEPTQEPDEPTQPETPEALIDKSEPVAPDPDGPTQDPTKPTDIPEPIDTTARDSELEALIDKGTYAVPIGMDKRTSRKLLVSLVLFMIIGGFVVLDILLDVGFMQLRGVPHTRFFSAKPTTTVSAPQSAAPVTTSSSAAELTADTVALAKSSLAVIRQGLVAYQTDNKSYPAELTAANLTLSDTSVLSPPAGVRYDYVPTPRGCTTAARNCTAYTLTAVGVAQNTTIATETASVVKQ